MARGAPNPPHAGTLDAFLVRRPPPLPTVECEDGEEEKEVHPVVVLPPHAPPPAPRACVAAHLRAARLAGGRPTPRARAAMARAAAASLEAAGLVPGRAAGGPAVAARFDGAGELLALAAGAAVAVYADSGLRGALVPGSDPPTPVLRLRVGGRVAGVAWDGGADDWLAVLRPQSTPAAPADLPGPSTNGFLALYDLTVCGDAPTRTLAPHPGAGGGGGARPSLTCLAPAAPRPHAYAAGDAAGHGHIFDARARSERAVAFLCGPGGGGRPALAPRARRAAAFADVVALASDGGDVTMWDVRVASSGVGGALGGLAGARALAHVHLPTALAALPGLGASAAGDCDLGPPAALDAAPRGGGLAFQTGCGWTGAVDAATARVSHLHAPPPAHARHAAAALHGAWAPASRLYLAPAAGGGGVVAVDCGGRASPARVEEGDGETHPAATLVPAPPASFITCVAVAPGTGEVVAGTACGGLALFRGAA